MAKFFGNLHLVLVAGLVLSLALMFGLHGDGLTAQSVTRWLHTFFGIVWIGLLYYFNFVQIPTMPKIPAELKPAVSKHIAPSALFFFRWAAALTVLLGLALTVFFFAIATRKFSSSAKLFVKMGRESVVLDPTAPGVTIAAISPGSVDTKPVEGELGFGTNFKQPNTIQPAESVAGIIKVIDSMTPAQNGKFLDFKDGRVIPW